MFGTFLLASRRALLTDAAVTEARDGCSAGLREIAPSPNLFVVMFSPAELRVMAPSPKREVMKVCPSELRVLHLSPKRVVV